VTARRRRVVRLPDHRAPAPRSLHRRTPVEQRAVEDALRSGSVWMAFGPVAGVCGHEHLSPGSAARCVEPARPQVGRHYQGTRCGAAPAVKFTVPPRRATVGDLIEAVAVLCLFAYVAFAVL
jgi:hypothetical protein